MKSGKKRLTTMDVRVPSLDQGFLMMYGVVKLGDPVTNHFRLERKDYNGAKQCHFNYEIAGSVRHRGSTDPMFQVTVHGMMMYDRYIMYV